MAAVCLREQNDGLTYEHEEHFSRTSVLILLRGGLADHTQ